MRKPDQDELEVGEFLAAKGFGLRWLESDAPPVEGRKTPDLELSVDATPVAYCEIKTLRGDPALENAPLGGTDSAYNRLTSDIKNAAEKFRAWNKDRALLSILVFLTRTWQADLGHLYDVLSGLFETDDGRHIPVYAKYALGQIRVLRREVDLYVWLEDGKRPHYITTSVMRIGEVHGRTGVDISKRFGINPTKPDRVFKALK